MFSTIFYSMGVQGFHILDRVLRSPMDEILSYLLTVSRSVVQCPVLQVVWFMFLFIVLTMLPFIWVILIAELPHLCSSRTPPHPFLPTFFLPFIDIFHDMSVLYSPSHPGNPTLFPGQFMWDLWLTKWHWEGFLSKFFKFHSSVFFKSHSSVTFHKYTVFIFHSSAADTVKC